MNQSNEKSSAGPVVKTWRERMGVSADFPLAVPSSVERAMEGEIADLRSTLGRNVFALLDVYELAALRRFNETCEDSEAYDLPKETMQRLAKIGAVQRKSGSYYEITEFGMYILEEPVAKSANAQPVAAMKVASVLTIPTAIMDIGCNSARGDEYKLGHRDARHAAADLVLARADELRALATQPIDMKGYLTAEQIAAGAAVRCEHGQAIGRNVAIDVFDAMKMELGR